MQITSLHPPKTLMEVYRMLPEGTRAELVNDKLFMSPAPTLNHQESALNLASEIRNFVMTNKLGKVFISPVDIFLNEKNAVQPDIVFISKKKKSFLKKDGIYGAPDLIIEILSPGSKKFDLEEKKKLYEASGVKEYWVVDPDTKECRGYQRKNSKYALFVQNKGKLSSALLKQSFKF